MAVRASHALGASARGRNYLKKKKKGKEYIRKYSLTRTGPLMVPFKYFNKENKSTEVCRPVRQLGRIEKDKI